MDLKELSKLTESFANTEKMPVLFLGHGSPMNAIEDNEFVRAFVKLGKELPKPKAILCISAHWETNGTFITAMEHPRTIHDFGGFPQALYDIQYPANGSPKLAATTKDIVHQTNIALDYSWGLDHGAWSVIKHLYPNADIPVIQMSLDYTKSAQFHYNLAQELAVLRRKGILIIGSGNMVHNLRLLAWNKIEGEPFAFDWAIEANEKMKSFILEEHFQYLVDYKNQGKAFELAIPTAEHYLPLLYAVALKEKQDETIIFNDEPIGGSLTMTSVKFE